MKAKVEGISCEMVLLPDGSIELRPATPEEEEMAREIIRYFRRCWAERLPPVIHKVALPPCGGAKS